MFVDFLKLKATITKANFDKIIEETKLKDSDAQIETDSNLQLSLSGDNVMEISFSNGNKCYILYLYAIYDKVNDLIKFDSTRNIGVAYGFFKYEVYDYEELNLDEVEDVNNIVQQFLTLLMQNCEGDPDDVEVLVNLSHGEYNYLLSSEKCKEYKTFGVNKYHALAIKEDCNISYEDEISTDFQYKLMDWLVSEEAKEIQEEMDKIADLNARMDLLGKWILSKKMNSEMESKKFLDLFIQAGTIGYSDNKLSMIYEIIK